MTILSHRGYWKKDIEKNSLVSFRKSFQLGYGVETDIRDYKGELVISHNISTETSVTIQDFFKVYNKHGKILPLALNIKADGLQQKLKEMIIKYNIDNYFVFDMSVPDSLQYIKNNINTFTRHSEYEPNPPLYNQSFGVWLDEFNNHWITKDVINQHIDNKKSICIVSPELHGRSHVKEWHNYKKIEEELNINNLMLCTDYPEEASIFFTKK